MSDGSRCDCLTATHAIEFDFASKWAESIGQALLYGEQTGRRPGVVLILEDEKDIHYVQRLLRVQRAYGLPLDVWIIGPEVSK